MPVDQGNPMDSIEVSASLPGTPERLFAAWIDAAQHAEMTEAPATSEPVVGGAFTAWDGYISGTHLELEAPRRLVQAWRASDFPEGAPDSRLEVRFAAVHGGTVVTVVHSGLPPGTGPNYARGWEEYYFEPMRSWLRG